jgi:hypothetical protein
MQALQPGCDCWILLSLASFLFGQYSAGTFVVWHRPVHFRIRKNVVQLVRTRYNPASKGPRAEIIGRVPLNVLQLPEELRERLTEEECEQARGWFEHNQRTVMLREEMAARTLAETLAAANRWFLRQEDLGQYSWISDNILPELTALRKTIKRVLD